MLTSVSTVEEIIAAIEKLSPRERCELNALLHPEPDDEWDKQMRADAESGKLDWMFEEARRDEEQGRLREFPESGE
jgi:hypothetical protein